MVLNIQIVGIIFMLVMLYLTFLYYKKNNYTRSALVFWAGVWVVAALMLVFPQVFSSIVERLSFARTTDFYLTIGLMFFGIITFLNYANVKRQERKVDELVRNIALAKKRK